MQGSDRRPRPSRWTAANSAEVVFTVDAQQRVVAWNSQAERVFGYPAAAAIGANCYLLVGARDELGRRFCRYGCPVIRTTRAGGVAPTMRLRAATRDGLPFTMDVSTIVMQTGDSPTSVIHLCREATAMPVTPGKPGSVELTSREQDVLRALCRGSSTEAIASELGVSLTTVRNHIQHLLAKLAAHSRAEAVAFAYRDGLNV